MTIEHSLTGELREKTGTAECRRLRRQGMVPANVYGHGRDSVSVKVPLSELNSLIAAGSRLFDLTYGDQKETVMFQQVQWDAFGVEMQHADFLRVDATERVSVEVPIDFRGNAPGALAGGILERPMQALTVECLAASIPDSIVVRLGALNIGDSIHVRDVEFPPGIVCESPEDALVCHVIEPVEAPEPEDEDGLAAPVEPEVIGKDAGDEESGD